MQRCYRNPFCNQERNLHPTTYPSRCLHNTGLDITQIWSIHSSTNGQVNCFHGEPSLSQVELGSPSRARQESPPKENPNQSPSAMGREEYRKTKSHTPRGGGWCARPSSVPVYLASPIWQDWALLRSKVDGFVPQTQHVNFGIVGQRE